MGQCVTVGVTRCHSVSQCPVTLGGLTKWEKYDMDWAKDITTHDE